MYPYTSHSVYFLVLSDLSFSRSSRILGQLKMVVSYLAYNMINSNPNKWRKNFTSDYTNRIYSDTDVNKQFCIAYLS
jgi:hypothetical protein